MRLFSQKCFSCSCYFRFIKIDSLKLKGIFAELVSFVNILLTKEASMSQRYSSIKILSGFLLDRLYLLPSLLLWKFYPVLSISDYSRISYLQLFLFVLSQILLLLQGQVIDIDLTCHPAKTLRTLKTISSQTNEN